MTERLADFGRRVDPEREVLVAVEGGRLVAQEQIHAFGTRIEGERFATGGFTNVERFLILQPLEKDRRRELTRRFLVVASRRSARA